MSKPTRTHRTGVRLLRLLAATMVVGVGAGAIVAVVDERSWPAAQLATVAVLSTTERTPLLAWLVRVVTEAPRVDERLVGGQRSVLVRPSGRGPWPALVFVNGATRAGRHHPQVQRFARGLGRAGFLVVVPELPGLRGGEITPATVAATTRVAEATADRPDVERRRVALYGVSVGASLALLAAERPELAGRLTVVAGEAPWTDLRRIIRLATTRLYDGTRYTMDPYAALAIARSLAAALPGGRGRTRLVRHFRATGDDNSAPLEGLEPRRLEGAARRLAELLANRDPSRFDALYARLAASVRGSVAALSPLRGAQRLVAPVELATSPQDTYFPPTESREIERAASRVRVTVTTTLDHAVPAPSLQEIGDLFRFDAFAVRVLRRARG